MTVAAGAAEAVTIPAAPGELPLEALFAMLVEHRRRSLWLQPSIPGGTPKALDGDPDALVTRLLRLSIEALLIHQLAEQEPRRPVAELLSQVVNQLKGS